VGSFGEQLWAGSGERHHEPTQRRYEALRAYLLEGRPAAEAAARFGYTEATLTSLVRDFRAGRREAQARRPSARGESAKGHGRQFRPSVNRARRLDAQ